MKNEILALFDAEKFDELEDFVFIQSELKRISITVETLKLWTEEMIAEGKIDIKQYKEISKRK